MQMAKLKEAVAEAESARVAKESQCEELSVKVDELGAENETLRSELDKKNQELKNLSKKTDEYLR